jgi:hypothetical protein
MPDNGQAEGQINRLKMLKRAMYGRAGVELLRARMFPLVDVSLHRVDLPPRIGGLRSEDHAASAMPTPFMMVRASVGV